MTHETASSGEGILYKNISSVSDPSSQASFPTELTEVPYVLPEIHVLSKTMGSNPLPSRSTSLNGI